MHGLCVYVARPDPTIRCSTAVARRSSSWSFFIAAFFQLFFLLLRSFIRAHIIKLFHRNIFSFASTFSSTMPCNRWILINLFAEHCIRFRWPCGASKKISEREKNAIERWFDSSSSFFLLGCVRMECGIRHKPNNDAKCVRK